MCEEKMEQTLNQQTERPGYQLPPITMLEKIPASDVVKQKSDCLRSLFDDPAWEKANGAMPLALGREASGNPLILDLAAAPHVLISGATGTGKSVCIDDVILSLIYKFTPDELKLILVDPKIVEFCCYETLPHLLTPIIHESGDCIRALRWASEEIDRRHHRIAEAGAKTLWEYNALERSEKIPRIVIIIDELADVMMTEERNEVEYLIGRISAKGGAAWIHLIVSTQRPSSNVITDVIKAHLPIRICFQVRCAEDSRVILESDGAEKLLGRGDMLFSSPPARVIRRAQCVFVKDEDIRKVIEFVSQQRPQHFDKDLPADAQAEYDDHKGFDEINAEDRAAIASLINKYLRPGDDETVRRALEVMIFEQKTTLSYIQRRLKIGYNRAAELVNLMKERGLIVPVEGIK